MDNVQKRGPESMQKTPLAGIAFETKRAIAKVVLETMIPQGEAASPPARVA